MAPAIPPAAADLSHLEPVEGALQLGGGHGVASMLGERLLGSTARRLGPGLVDVLRTLGRIREDDVIAAGTQDLSDEDWHTMLATHLDSTFFCTRDILRVRAASQFPNNSTPH